MNNSCQVGEVVVQYSFGVVMLLLLLLLLYLNPFLYTFYQTLPVVLQQQQE
jgi:hypothetical protein